MIKSSFAALGFGLVAGTGLFSSAAAKPVELRDFQWKNRLLVVCDLASSSTHPLERDLSTAAVQIMLDDHDNVRKLSLVHVIGSEWTVLVTAPDPQRGDIGTLDAVCPACEYEFEERERAAITERLSCRPGDRVMALIGLDGGVKKTWRRGLPSADEVYSLIDAMPLRVEEMRGAAQE